MKKYQKYSVLIFLFATSISIFALYGFHGTLYKDDATYIYGGQRMAEGIPPYVGVFGHKGPLSHMIAGFGVKLAEFLAFDDILSIRVVFFLLSCLSIIALYFLAVELVRSERAGIFSAITFLTFHGFALHAASGPRPKTPMVLFEILCFLFTARKKWFWGGLFGSLAFLVWQPCAIFPLATLTIAVFQTPSERFRATIKTSVGILTPIFLVSAYFIYHKAFYDLLEQMILFNVLYLNRGEFTILHHFVQSAVALKYGYPLALMAILLGLAVIILLYFDRNQQNKSWKKTFTNDPFSIIFLTYPFPFIWSLIDFQGYPDFYVFLPYAALGFGIFIDSAAQRLPVGFSTDRLIVRTLTVVLFLIPLLMVTIINAKTTRNYRLELQRKSALEIKERFGDDAKLVAIGVPELLVLLNRPNPNRYLFLYNGMNDFIASKYEDGFDGYIKEIQEYNPDIIAIEDIRQREVTTKLKNWVETNYTKEKIGVFKIYVRRNFLPNKVNR